MSAHLDRTRASVADAVYAQFSSGENHGPTDYADSRPLLGVAEDGVVQLCEWELDLRDWGIAFGMAWAIHRADDPFATTRDIGECAFNDGWAAYTRWGDGFNHERPAALEQAEV